MSVSSSRLPGSDQDDLDSSAINDGSNAALKATVTAANALKVDGSAVTQPTTEAEYATFTVVEQAIASANNKSLISILNASGSPVKIKLRELKLVNTQNTAVTGVVADINLYRMTGHSAGTALTPQAMDTTDTLDSNVTTRTGATIAGESAAALLHIDLSTDEWSAGASDVESNAHALQSLNSFYRTAPKTKPITLNAGQGVTLKCVTNTTTGLFDIIMVFTQEST